MPNARAEDFHSEHKLRYVATLIKQRVLVPDIAARFGFDYTVPGRLPCPACHEESTTQKTVSLYDDGARWYCFRCNEGGDVISWLAARLDVAPSAAIHRLCGVVNLELDGDTMIAYLRGQLKPTIGLGTPVAFGNMLAAVRALRRRRDRSLAALLADPQTGPDAIRQAVAYYQHAVLGVYRNQAERMPTLADTVSTMRCYGQGGIEQIHGDAADLLIAIADESERYTQAIPDLRHEPLALDYLRRRQFTAATLRLFGFGYCPDTSADNPVLERVGLCWKNGTPSLRHRIVFPIRDAAGRAVAMAGRSFSTTPKWINTADSPVYAKRCFLFGLDVAFADMLRTRRVVIGEGYSDAVAFARAGLPGVAAAGTSLTPEHVLTLRGLVEEVVLFFDGDTAGADATARAADLCRGHIPTVKAVVRPPGSPDPDECPDDVLRYLVSAAVPVWRDRDPAAWSAAIRRRLQ